MCFWPTGLAAHHRTLASVAAELGIGERTLRRRLDEEGTRYRRLLDEVRRERAGALVADPGLGSDSAAYLLGFSDASALAKALRRWHLKRPSPGCRKVDP